MGCKSSGWHLVCWPTHACLIYYLVLVSCWLLCKFLSRDFPRRHFCNFCFPSTGSNQGCPKDQDRQAYEGERTTRWRKTLNVCGLLINNFLGNCFVRLIFVLCIQYISMLNASHSISIDLNWETSFRYDQGWHFWINCLLIERNI